MMIVAFSLIALLTALQAAAPLTCVCDTQANRDGLRELSNATNVSQWTNPTGR